MSTVRNGGCMPKSNFKVVWGELHFLGLLDSGIQVGDCNPQNPWHKNEGEIDNTHRFSV